MLFIPRVMTDAVSMNYNNSTVRLISYSHCRMVLIELMRHFGEYRTFGRFHAYDNSKLIFQIKRLTAKIITLKVTNF